MLLEVQLHLLVEVGCWVLLCLFRIGRSKEHQE